MVDTALFSSFHRPRSPLGVPGDDVPGAATTTTDQVDPTRPEPSASDLEAPEPPANVDLEPEIQSDPAHLPTERPSQDVPGADWVDLSAIPLECDQLGLANPAVITLVAHLPGSEAIPLEAATDGIYRPPSFRPAPWSGFAYDQASDALSGLAAGTRILTARGEVEVERLMPGDIALALRSPALLPISWIGRSLATAHPIRIEPGALGPDVPRRAICLGPEQAVFIQPIPVPARTLVNGTTIREMEAGTSDLFHVDVGRAEVLFAEGIPLSSSHRAGLHTG